MRDEKTEIALTLLNINALGNYVQLHYQVRDYIVRFVVAITSRVSFGV